MSQFSKSFKSLDMTTPQIKTTHRVHRRRSGMTLIELLVAISILVIIAAILVPQLRLASADRNIREASRMVASLFAQASQRGSNDGVAGVLIERNPNIEDGSYYAGTSMFILREVPRYAGDQESDRAAYVSDTSVSIPLPFEQEEGLGLIQVGDQVSFGDQLSIRFRITNVATSGTDLQLDLDPPSFLKAVAPAGADNKFTIHRQPRKLESSRIDMPTGYLVDLRLSGEMGTGGMLFGLDSRVPNADSDVPSSITYLFNGRGSIDRFFYTDGAGARQTVLPTQTAYLLVREYNPDDGGESVASVLNNERQMWVTVDPTTGAANVVPGVPVDLGGAALSQQALREARTLGSTGQAAQ